MATALHFMLQGDAGCNRRDLVLNQPEHTARSAVDAIELDIDVTDTLVANVAAARWITATGAALAIQQLPPRGAAQGRQSRPARPLPEP